MELLNGSCRVCFVLYDNLKKLGTSSILCLASSKTQHSLFLPVHGVLEACLGLEQSRLPSQDSLVYSEASSQEAEVRFLQESACSRVTIPQCAILFWPDLLETGTSCHRVSSRGWEKEGNDLFLLWCLFLKDMQGLPLVLILPKCHNCVEAPVQLHHFSRPGHLNLYY